MFLTRTTFILGAGASADMKLPIGTGLCTDIISALTIGERGTRMFADDAMQVAFEAVMREHPREKQEEIIGKYDAARNLLRSGLQIAPSIDNFVHTHSGNSELVLLAKIAIARCILNAEKESHLAPKFDQQMQLKFHGTSNPLRFSDAMKAGWYIPFMRMMIAGARRDAIEDLFQNVTFIIFNYDRCLEYFLMRCLTAYFSLDNATATKVISKARFIHPYGQVGFLHWQGQTPSVGFGTSDAGDLLPVSQQIKTFTQAADSDVENKIKGVIRDSDVIVFMGFGFLEQSLELMSVTESKARRVFLTTDGISSDDVPVIHGEIAKMMNRQIEEGKNDRLMIYNEPKKCVDLIQNHRFRLTRAD